MQTVGNSGAIKSVQVKGPNSHWKGLNNIWGATWEIANQPSLPIDLHVTADNGQEVGYFCWTAEVACAFRHTDMLGDAQSYAHSWHDICMAPLWGHELTDTLAPLN